MRSRRASNTSGNCRTWIEDGDDGEGSAITFGRVSAAIVERPAQCRGSCRTGVYGGVSLLLPYRTGAAVWRCSRAYPYCTTALRFANAWLSQSRIGVAACSAPADGSLRGERL